MKVLLINPNFRGARGAYDVSVRLRQPLDLAYLAAILEKKGIDNEILDANVLALSQNEIMEKIDELSPSHVILTTSPLDRWECPQVDISMVFSLIKKINPSLKLIVYGAHGSVDPQWVWEKSDKRIDYIIKGEPEKPISELFDLFSAGRQDAVKGVSYKKDGRLMINSEYNVYQNIDEIPSPSFKKLRMDLYDENILLSSRGCPFQCTFCLREMFKGYRVHSPERVVREIKYLRENYSIASVFFQDWEFLLDKARAEKIGELMKESNLYIDFGFNARAQDLDFELIKNLQAVGLKRINLGLESASDKILKAVKKGISKDDLANSVALARNTGVKIGYYGISSLPLEDIGTIKETARFIAQNNLEFGFGAVRLYPGTELARGRDVTWENMEAQTRKMAAEIHPMIALILYKFFIQYYRDGLFFILKPGNFKKGFLFLGRFFKKLT